MTYRLNLPRFDARVAKNGDRYTILDTLRRKYVALTPEEWVRQHFIHYLIQHKGYPGVYLANEIELRIGDKKMRCDSVLYDSDLRPRIIMEYKAPTVQLTQKVFDQITAYNILLHVDYIIVSNGIQHYCCRMDYENNSYSFLPEIPDYSNL